MKNTKILLVGSLLFGTMLFSKGINESKLVNAAENDTYELVTDASKLSIGDNIIIASSDGKKVLGTEGTNNRKAIDSTIDSNNKIKYVSGFQDITLEKGKIDNTWAFKIDSGYLYAANSKNNYLKTENVLSNNSSWKITFSNNNATIVAQGENTRNNLKYNSSSSIFSCYSNGQNPVSIYKNLSNYYNVNYETNCDIKVESIKVKEGNQIILPTEDLTKENYIFEGWYTDSNFENKFVEGTLMGNEDITLYAHWIEDTRTQYTVTFMMNDGTDTQVSSVIVRENDKVEEPNNPKRTGYEFTNWYTSSDLKTVFDFETPITTNVTLYAGWEELKISTYTKVTSNLDDWSGKYLIVYETDTDIKIFNSSLNELDVANNNVSIEKNNSSNIIEGIYEEYEFTFEKNDNNTYSIKSFSNSFIGYTASKGNGISESDSTKYENTISYSDSNNILTIKSSGGAILKYNDTKDQNRFRFYQSGQKNISLYKLDEPTMDKTVLTSSFSTLTINNLKAIRFVGSVKETEFNNISKIGFNFILTLDSNKDNPVTKEYQSDVTKLYNQINDQNIGVFDKNDAIYEKDGYLCFSLILKNLPKELMANIEFYSYATINNKIYNSSVANILIVGDNIE